MNDVTNPGRAGTRINENGRFNTSPQWPQGGFVTRPVVDRNYDVQQYTGYSYSTVPGSNWDRGRYYRGYTVELRPPREQFMFDPTDINTYGAKYGDFAGYAGFRSKF